MSFPFIIWTMQRTGGTALTDLLMAMSEHRSAEHEPFNWSRKKPRQFWPIAEAWNETRDAVALARALGAVFAERYLIKHCYELFAMPFNLHLLAASAQSEYRHVHLLRREEAARLVSKFIAEAQGTWFKPYARQVFAEVAEGNRQLGPLPVDRVVEHFRHCRDVTATITEALRRHNVACKLIHYEDLYVGEAAPRLAVMTGLLEFLGFTPAEIERHRPRIEQTLFHAGQNTRAVAPFVPNLTEVLAALQEAGCAAEDNAAPLRGAARIVSEFAQMAETHRAAGPYLEIGTGPQGTTILGHSYFVGADMHALADHAASEVICHAGDPHDMREVFADGQFNTVLWNGAIAHDNFFWRTIEEMQRVLAPGGLMLLAAPGFSRHAALGAKGNPIANATITQRAQAAPDFWRISPQAMRQVILAGMEVLEVRMAMTPPLVFAAARK